MIFRASSRGRSRPGAPLQQIWTCRRSGSSQESHPPHRTRPVSGAVQTNGPDRADDPVPLQVRGMRPGAPTATSMSDIEVGRAPPTRRTSGSGAPTELVLNGAPDPRGNGSVVGIGAFPDPLEDLGGEPHGDRRGESPRPPPRGPLRHLVGGLGEEVVLLLRSHGVNTHVYPFRRQRSCRSRRPRRVPSRGSRGCGPGPGAPPARAPPPGSRPARWPPRHRRRVWAPPLGESFR